MIIMEMLKIHKIKFFIHMFKLVIDSIHHHVLCSIQDVLFSIQDVLLSIEHIIHVRNIGLMYEDLKT